MGKSQETIWSLTALLKVPEEVILRGEPVGDLLDLEGVALLHVG